MRVFGFGFWMAVVSLGAAAVAGAQPPGIARGPGYASSSWVTLHGDSSNSDFVPFATSTDLERRWRVLEGAGIVVPPVIAPDGMLYVTTGRGPGKSHLHAIRPTGGLQWQTEPQRSPADLDSGAVLSAPVLDEDGDVYVGDSNQFFAFHADGRRKWVAELADYGAAGPFVTGVILGSRVGGITVNGQVLLFERATGALAAPMLELPGGASPLGPVPDFVWREGLIDPALRETVFEALLGYRFEVTNTPAVHPETQRIYLMAGGRTTSEGVFYGIDLVERDEREAGLQHEGAAASPPAELEIAFETRTAPGTGTSPAISPDGSLVYAFGGAGELFAIDAATGELIFSVPVGGLQASPSIDLDGSLYVLAGSAISKIDGTSGEVVWSRNYDAFAVEQLPAVSSWWPFVTTGEPVARPDSVITIAPNAIWVALLCGYEIRVAGRDLVQAKRSWLAAIDPKSGNLMASYPIPDTSEGAISVGSTGEIYLDLLAIQASVAAHAPFARWLPRALRSDPPRGGLVKFAPRSRTAQAALGLGWAGDLLARKPVYGPSDRLRAVRAQLEAVASLGVGLEVSLERSDEVKAAIRGALEAIWHCEAGDRGDTGCSALPVWSRELRTLRSVLQQEAEEPVSAPLVPLENDSRVRDNMSPGQPRAGSARAG